MGEGGWLQNHGYRIMGYQGGRGFKLEGRTDMDAHGQARTGTDDGWLQVRSWRVTAEAKSKQETVAAEKRLPAVMGAPAAVTEGPKPMAQVGLIANRWFPGSRT